MGSSASGSRFFDWDGGSDVLTRTQLVVDESCRDGLQGGNVTRRPTLEERDGLLERAFRLGVLDCNLGLPVNPAAIEECSRLATFAAKRGQRPHVACRTVVSDIEGALRVAESAGIPALEVCAFNGGTAPIRREVEGWTTEKVTEDINRSITFGVQRGLRMSLVLEDMSRTAMEWLRNAILVGMNAGATRLVVTDTVGSMTPTGVPRLLGALRQLLADHGFGHVPMDWHGHNDRGLAVANALAAAMSGLVDRVHATVLGIGERTGNPDMAQLLLNLHLEGLYPAEKLAGLMEYTRYGSVVTGVPIPDNHPVTGRLSLSTATGVHAAAVAKGHSGGDPELEGLVYLPFDPRLIGRHPEILVGFMSGKSNAVTVLTRLGIPTTDENVGALLSYVQHHKHNVLMDDEVQAWADGEAGHTAT